MTALYSNENFPVPAVDELRRLGHNVLTIQDTGRAARAMPDEEVLRYAAAENRVLLTLNRKHFIRLHQTDPAHAGIVVCTFDPDFVALARRIDEALTRQADIRGQLLRIVRPAAD